MRWPKIPFDRREPGFWISAAVHVGVLSLALVSIAAPMPEAEEGVPVEVITENQFSELTRGERDAEKPQEKPNHADRVDEKLEDREPENAKTDAPTAPTRPAEIKVASVEAIPLRSEMTESIKEEAAAAAAKAAAAKAEAKAKADAAAEKAAEKAAAAKAEAQRRDELQKLVEREEAEEAARAEAAKEAAKEAARKEAKAKAAAKAKAEADAKVKADAEQQKKLAEAKVKAEADAKAKAEADAKAKEAAAKAKALTEAKAKADAEAKAKKLAEQSEKFNSGDIRQLLASKAPSQSTGATGRDVQRVASLGTATGASQKLSPSMRDALVGMLQQQIERCYSAPPGAAQGVVLPMLDIRLNPDGSLSTDPKIMRGGASAVDVSLAQAALRAVRRCAPYRIPAQYAPFYNDWKAINAEFEFSRV